MAKKAYIGVDGLARKIKKGYIGIETEVPVYEESTTSLNINGSNIDSIFTVDNDGYYFGSGYYADNSIFCSNNWGGEYEDGEEYDDTSVARTTLIALVDMDISFTYSYSSEANYDKFYLTIGNDIIENGVSGATTVKEYSGHIGAGTQIEFRYEKDGSVNGYDDECKFYNMVVIYIDTVQTGTELKPVARRIKKAYIGIGGIARPCFETEKIVTYYGIVDGIPNPVRYASVLSFGDYGLIAGGEYYEEIYDSDTNTYDYIPYLTSDVQGYTKSLTCSYLTSINAPVEDAAATVLKDYAIFFGGHEWEYDEEYDTTFGVSSNQVTVFNSSLTRLNNVSFSQYANGYPSGTSIGDYAIFSNSYGYGLTIYDTSFTQRIISSNLTAREAPSANNTSTYAIFAGGEKSYTDVDKGWHSTDIVEACDASLTFITCQPLDDYRQNMATAKAGDNVLFGGGCTVWREGGGSGEPVWHEDVCAYDKSLTKHTLNELIFGSSGHSATMLGDYAIFIGSIGAGIGARDAVIYDENFTQSFEEYVNYSHAKAYGITVGDYAIFAGHQGYPPTGDAFAFTLSDSKK